MRDFLKNMKLNASLSAVMCVVLGLILVIWPGVVGTVFCYIVGGALLISGIVHIVSYVRERDNASLFQVDFLMGLILGVLGGWIILKPNTVLSLMPILLGIVLLLHGFVDVQRALNLKRAGYAKWGAAIAVATITVVFGAVMLFHPLMAVDVALRLLGAGLLFDGVSDLWMLSRISKFIDD